MGNRGCLHADGEIVRPHRGKLWIACALDFRGRRVEQWVPGRYTVLFFHDEAVSLAAGHRPCGQCRHERYTAFTAAWRAAFGSTPTARDMNERLHADRLDGRRQRVHTAAWASLPDGTFAIERETPVLVRGDRLHPWDDAAHGYGPARDRPRAGDATVLTPRATVAVLAAGYEPAVERA
jgi:hypothetical protein